MMMMFSIVLLVLLPVMAHANEDVLEALDMTVGSPSEVLPQPPAVPQCCGMEDLKQTLVQQQQENRGLFSEMVAVLNQLAQENKESSSTQAEILKVLRVMREQQEQQLTHMMNMARHQSLLVENHQALLFQVSRIGSQLQEITKKQ